MRSSSLLASFTYLALILAPLMSQVAALPLEEATESETLDVELMGRPGGPGHGPGRPNPPGPPRCRKLEVRKEWRDMKKNEKKKYIASVKCLMGKPPVNNVFGHATNRFDEFQVTHNVIADRIHAVGMFLPWHRRFVTLYTNALREECGYKGPTPYWDWSRDADSTLPMSASPVFDPDTGFGGDGVPGTFTLPPPAPGTQYYNPNNWKGCVPDGPFATTTFNVGPGMHNMPHCLVRGFDEVQWREAMTSASVNFAMASTSYDEFRTRVHLPVNKGIHTGGHFFVGGEMGDAGSSPGDPIFYLHHANLDRVWHEWQLVDPAARFNDISGPSYNRGDDQIDLDWVMDFPGIGANFTVRAIMDPSKAPECFRYE